MLANCSKMKKILTKKSQKKKGIISDTLLFNTI
jgi:hypothetical protein